VSTLGLAGGARHRTVLAGIMRRLRRSSRRRCNRQNQIVEGYRQTCGKASTLLSTSTRPSP